MTQKINGIENYKKPRWLLPVVLCLIAFICFSLWFFRVHYLFESKDYQRIESTSGTWDLTELDYKNSFARLNGETEYIPGALLTPEEFEARSDEAQIGYIDDDPVNTARLKVIVPDDAIYMLAMNSVDFSERIYINGQWRQDAGKPGLTAELTTPGYSYMYFEVEPEDGVIEIVRQSANFVHRENGGAAGIRIGSPQMMKRHLALETDLTALSMGLFLALFLAHIILFIILRSYKANLYFALLCLTWFLRSGVTGTKPFSALIPDLPWEVMFRLEYLTAPLAGILILLIIRQVFPAIYPRWFLPAFGGLFGVYALCCLFVPTIPLSYSMIIFEILFVFVGCTVLALLSIRLSHMTREKKALPEHWVMFVGYVFFLFATIHDALYYNGIYIFGKGFVMNDLALMIFAMFQMVVMFYATMRRKQIMSGIPEENLVTQGELIINTLSSKAYLDGRDLLLTPKEFALLQYFVGHEGEIVNRHTIYESIWKQPISDNDRTLASHIHHLRKKLEGSGYTIESRRGKGYVLVKA